MTQRRGTHQPGSAAARYNEYVAWALQAERSAHRLTISELSDLSGVPPRTLHRVLHAERAIDAQQIAQLAWAIGVEPKDIMDEASRRMARDDARMAAPPSGDTQADHRRMLADPATDSELQRRLADVDALTGVNGRARASLRGEIARTRNEELRGFLIAPPESDQHPGGLQGSC